MPKFSLQFAIVYMYFCNVFMNNNNKYCTLYVLDGVLSLSSQNTSSGDRSYTVAGIWETGVPFLASLNEETPKGKHSA